MHRRRGNQALEPDHDNDIHDVLPSSSQTRRRRHHQSASGGRGRCSGSFIFLLNIALLFFLLIQLELMAYRMLGDDSSSTKSTASTAKAKSHASSNNNNIPSPKQAVPTPSKSPSQALNQVTMEPSNDGRRWRLKSAKIDTNISMHFWQTNVPDVVPPLPPDIDPETGAKLPPVIAYVTSLTKCGPKHRGGLDGAAVLMQSIRRNSYGWVPLQEQYKNANIPMEDANLSPQYGGQGGRYRYRAYVIVDPIASPTSKWRNGECARFLQNIGYTVLHRPPLVPLFEVNTMTGENSTSDYYYELANEGYVGMQRPASAMKPGENPNKLRMYMFNDGCCGYTEMLKLHVYGMVEHELAVHLDFDSLLLRPMDDLFDAMLGKGDEATRKKLPLAKLPQSKGVDFSKPIHAAFTRDYNSVNHPKPEAPVGYQGGFLVVRPSLEVLERYRTILRRAEFHTGPRDGWGGKHGGFYGDVTFQGILPYYYEDVAPAGEHNEAELDRCIYNQMADNPRKSTYKFPRATPLDPDKMGFKDTNVCRDGRKDCSDTDCQHVHPKESITTHFTFCKKPWDCSEGNPGTVVTETCLGLLKEWYAIRRELEDWWLLPSEYNTGGYYWNDKTKSKVQKSRKGTWNSTQYFGYCDKAGSDGYHKLVEPNEDNA